MKIIYMGNILKIKSQKTVQFGVYISKYTHGYCLTIHFGKTTWMIGL